MLDNTYPDLPKLYNASVLSTDAAVAQCREMLRQLSKDLSDSELKTSLGDHFPFLEKCVTGKVSLERMFTMLFRLGHPVKVTIE